MSSSVPLTSATAPGVPVRGADLLARDRRTGDLLRFAWHGPESYAAPERIGAGFGVDTVPVLGAGQGISGITLWYAGASGLPVGVPGRPFFDAASCLTEPPGSGFGVIVATPDGTLLTQRPGATTIEDRPAVPGAPGVTVATVPRGTVLVGAGNVTTGRRHDIVVQGPDGRLAVLERSGGAGQWYRFTAELPGLRGIRLVDTSGDGLAGCAGVVPDGTLVVYPHSGVFWPQDPDTVLLSPVALAGGWHDLDILQ
ncbi:hypothetical protein GCM10010435_24120 [Winogradskya consettensis]|uniref:Uncharacterized protein n=1 Tax=Winogradskya consettensis TaxID=113560 RepID=A0A919T303_9ACTN|nr:hypothetical protein [Actinoplanes consettensis]GIM82430.1 hypothetical protein Aco04nite_81440 [Actinoplanes consettensis]